MNIRNVRNQGTIAVLTAALWLAAMSGAQAETWNNGSGNMLWDTNSVNWGIKWVNDGTKYAGFDATGVGTVNVALPIQADYVNINYSGYTFTNCSIKCMRYGIGGLRANNITVTFGNMWDINGYVLCFGYPNGSDSMGTGTVVNVVGAGVITNVTTIYTGSQGRLNMMDGGTVYAGNYHWGRNTGNNSSNVVVVSGNNSAFNITTLYMGYNGSSYHSLIVTNGGKVRSATGNFGNTGNNNTVTVSGTNSSASFSSNVTLGKDTTCQDNLMNVADYGRVSVLNNVDMSGLRGQITVTNGGQFTCGNTFYLGASGANSNTMTVVGSNSFGSVNTLYVGNNNSTCIGNMLNVADRSNFSVTNTVYMNGQKGQITVMNGGQFACSNTFNLGNTGNSGNTLTIAGVNSFGFAKSMSVGQNSNLLCVADRGSFLVSGDFYMQSPRGQVVVTNGGQLTCNGAFYIGLYGAGNSNTMTVAGAGSLGSMPTLIVGHSTSCTGNVLTVTDAGVVSTYTLYVNGVRSLLSVTNGGTLRFTRGAPGVTTSGVDNVVLVSGGKLGYYGVQSGRPTLTDNTTASGVGLFTWTGNNTLQLDNSQCVNASSGYTLGTGQPNGAKNFAALEMINGNTAVAGTQPLTVAGTGALLVSNTTAVIFGVYTNNGMLKMVDSTLTCTNGCVLGEGTTINWSGTNAQIKVFGAMALTGQRTLVVTNVPMTSLPMTLVSGYTSLSDSGSWIVTPTTYQVRKSGNALVLDKIRGTMIKIL